jgi:threonyl-tRNA synthetase
MKIAAGISKSLAGDIVIAKVNGELWDLDRPLESSCNLQFLKFSDEEGRAVYWHSSAHVLGEAAERHFGCLLSHGPPTQDGFFYDMAMDQYVILSDPSELTHQFGHHRRLCSFGKDCTVCHS